MDNAQRITILERRLADLEREFRVALLRPGGRDRAETLSHLIQSTRQELNDLKKKSESNAPPFAAV
ncbi:MAG TPA: hypothetical protein QGF05_05830 [Dehalococcoidia bacterium]|nr:hypothetical protein [Dehalococcoidia bacterium]